MEPQYYIEIFIHDGSEAIERDIGKTETWSFEQAKQIAGSLFVGGYIDKEDMLSLSPNFTLYAPHQIKKVRLVAKALIQ